MTEYEPDRPQDDDLLAGAVRGASAGWQVERRAARAWPASFTEERGGWLLRHTPGTSRRRSNSALPLLGHPPVIDEMADHYRELGLPARVQVSPAEQYGSLDASLAALGYSLDGRTLVLTAPAAVVAATPGPDVPIEKVDDRTRWPQFFASLDGRSGNVDIVTRIGAPTALLTVTVAGQPAGMGLFAADSGWAGVFCMAVHPAHRRQGIATAILTAGAAWAAGEGAGRLYLQVEEHNEAARDLYTRSGFTLSHTYHYRTLE